MSKSAEQEKRDLISSNLSKTINQTDFKTLGVKVVGKVRDSYIAKDVRYLVTTDRLSCFDVCITTIPFKGQLLNQIALAGFKATETIVPNHIIDVPDPNIMVVRECQVLPLEIVVRGYLAGSGWRSYQKIGSISGVILPAGMKEFAKLPEPIITPSTKAPQGEHDQPISGPEIIAAGILSEPRWQQLQEIALELFKVGTEQASSRGLILADTKYEIGLIGERFVLVDELHTLDSSRFWIADSYSDLLAQGAAPKMLDKEPARRWLKAQGFDGHGNLPLITDSWREDVALHYLESAEKILGPALKLDIEEPNKRLLECVKRM
jgi:phosphoribosylaminoimidazole-succinocarboxamide synthase